MMIDNIKFTKIWQDNNIIELKVDCCSSVVSVTSNIYVSDSLIDELCCTIKHFIDGNVGESLWANEEKGNSSTACLSLQFFKKDKLGHILIEVFVELDDDGDFDKHNCCFFVNTEYGLLMNFSKQLVLLKESSIGEEIQLNPSACTGDGSRPLKKS